MAELKTRPTGASVDDYIASRANATQHADCAELIAIHSRVTGEPPVMWGPSIVGFGTYRYPVAKGGSAEMCEAGFAIRGRELVVYILAEGPEQQARLARLGPHKMGKSCLYVKRLADLDRSVLEELVAASVAEVRRRHPKGAGAG